MEQGLSDKELFEGLLDPNQTRQTFEQLYRSVYPMVKQQIKTMGGNEDDARDVFQEGVLSLWKNAQNGRFTWRQDSKMSTYLVEICKRRWLDQRRKASSRYEQASEQLPEEPEQANVLSHWIRREEQESFQKRFQQLGERCQDLLQRFYYQKQSMKEISAALRIGESTAKNEKYRCMQRLKQLFQTSTSRS